PLHFNERPTSSVVHASVGLKKADRCRSPAKMLKVLRLIEPARVYRTWLSGATFAEAMVTVATYRPHRSDESFDGAPVILKKTSRWMLACGRTSTSPWGTYGRCAASCGKRTCSAPRTAATPRK